VKAAYGKRRTCSFERGFVPTQQQAVAYRQLSLLLRRPPGREAYPGDVGRPLVVIMDAGGKSSLRCHRLV
jgi:hypothetical protein